jgi:MFS family permease
MALLSANLISGVGNYLTMLAIPWFVLETTDSASKTGVTAAVGLLSVIPAGIFGGALVDRLGFKRMSIAADLASCLTVAAIPLLYHTIGLAFWQLLVLVFLSGVLDVPGSIARRSLSPELSALAGMPLERTNGLYQMGNRISGLVGPLLSGVLIALIGTSNVLWLDAASFVVSAAVVAITVPAALASRGKAAKEAGEQSSSSYFGEILEGLRFLRGDQVVLSLVVMFAVVGMLAEPFWGVILPVYSREVYGSAVGLGVIFSAMAAGALLGDLIYIAIGPRLPRRGIILAAFTLRALWYTLLIAFAPLPVYAITVVVVVIFAEPINPIVDTVLMERIPVELRGRVFGVLDALFMSARPLGLLVYGVLIDQIGLRETLMVLASVNLLVVVILFFLPALHVLHSTRPLRDADAPT